ncbi:hypothetical protein [Kribbella shirazensis]|uniref:Uncharacterized protein n=1 Tax=Kribbella shirazensis TaxID=1105143 RepID=A0A7X5VDA2_9ACTN|nr:hypothetical protein [Kribbella shirazensis]NIK58223.1 hypothetical protein [Kribbella shirazensis]
MFTTGPGHVTVIDVHTGELLSITSATPLSAAVVEKFDALPGVKTYTVDFYGRVMSIARS